MPAKAPSKKSTGMTKAEIAKRNKKFMEAVAPFLPGGAAAVIAAEGTKALTKKKAKEKDSMRWKVGKKSKTIDLKKGGKVKKRAKGGGVKK